MPTPLTATQIRFLRAALSAPHAPDALVRFAAHHEDSRRLDLARLVLPRHDLPDDLFDLVFKVALTYDNSDTDIAIFEAAMRLYGRGASPEVVTEFLVGEARFRRPPYGYLRRVLVTLPKGDPLRRAMLASDDPDWLVAVLAAAASSPGNWIMVEDTLTTLATYGTGGSRDLVAAAGRSAMPRLVEYAPKRAVRVVRNVGDHTLLLHWLGDVTDGHISRYTAPKWNQGALGKAVATHVLIPAMVAQRPTYGTINPIARSFAATWGKGTCRALVDQAGAVLSANPSDTRARIAELLRDLAKERLAALTGTCPVPSTTPLNVIPLDSPELGDWLVTELGEVAARQDHWEAIMMIVDALGQTATLADAVNAISGATRPRHA